MEKSKLKKIIRKALRERGWPTNRDALRRLKNVDHRINERAEWADAFYWHARDGKVALIREGMDCDCTQYRHVSHIDVPKSLVAFVRDEEEHRRWLDGTERTWVDSPYDEEEEDLYSDRALEAYEEGHPGTVTWADRSEMRSSL